MSIYLTRYPGPALGDEATLIRESFEHGEGETVFVTLLSATGCWTLGAGMQVF